MNIIYSNRTNAPKLDFKQNITQHDLINAGNLSALEREN